MRLTKQGVRDLNHLKPDLPPRQPVKLGYLPTQVDKIIVRDLIYDDTQSIRDSILEKFQKAALEPTYDYIHGNRLGVILGCDQREWFEFLIREGLTGVSLVFQMYMLDSPEYISSILDGMRPDWRE